MSYKHINSEDRIVIDTLLAESRSKAYIARRLGVDRSSIGREVERNASKPKPKASKPVSRPKIVDVDGRSLRGTGDVKAKYAALAAYNKALSKQAARDRYYYAGLAHTRTKARRKKSNQKRLRLVHGSGSFLEQYVLDKLTVEHW